jgi:hypothetical protein
MRLIATSTLATLSLLLACGGGNEAVRLDPGTEDVNRWRATMSSPPQLSGAVQIDGTAWMTDSGDGGTRLNIELRNAAPGGIHPWLVQYGRCGADRGIFGSMSDYQALEVGRDGTASATTVIEEPLPEDGSYSVAVLASPTNRDLVIACGNLAPPVAQDR